MSHCTVNGARLLMIDEQEVVEVSDDETVPASKAKSLAARRPSRAAGTDDFPTRFQTRCVIADAHAR